MSVRVSVPDCVVDALDAAARKSGLTRQQMLVRVIGLLQQTEGISFWDLAPRKPANAED